MHRAVWPGLRGTSCLKILLSERPPQQPLLFSTSPKQSQQVTSTSFKAVQKKLFGIGPSGYLLLVIPVAAFGLGTWQVKRRAWKLNLIASLEERIHADPIELPQDLSELQDLEYRKVIVRGKFDHSQELYLGPRSLLSSAEAKPNPGGAIINLNNAGQSGTLVVTPFKLSDRNATILVNRGWVSRKNKNPAARPEGQVSEEVEIVGVVRVTEKRPQFTPKNDPLQNTWFHRDINAMAQVVDAAPVFLDAAYTSTVPGGPIGGQTRVSLRNEHLSYIFTWYALCGATSFMWYRRYIRGFTII